MAIVDRVSVQGDHSIVNGCIEAIPSVGPKHPGKLGDIRLISATKDAIRGSGNELSERHVRGSLPAVGNDRADFCLNIRAEDNKQILSQKAFYLSAEAIRRAEM